MPSSSFDSVLIAGRGLVACRIVETLSRLGIRTIAIHSEAERHAPHVLRADRAVCVGASPEQSYANGAAILDAARISGAQAIHPALGPLRTNPGFSRATEQLGLSFLGPTADQLTLLGNRGACLNRALVAGIPCEPGTPVQHARHILVPLFGDGKGNVIVLGEQDISVRRKDGVMLAESPVPNLPAPVRRRMVDAALALTRSVAYRDAGSVEFEYDVDRGTFHFAAFHPFFGAGHLLTEALYDVDLVEWSVQTASAAPPAFDTLEHPSARHAFQVRVFAELPANRATASLLTEIVPPELASSRSGHAAGDVIDAASDPLMLAFVVKASSRAEALSALSRSLDAVRIGGVESNLDHLRQIVRDPLLSAAELTTRSLERLVPDATRIEVISGGPLSIVVDHPGRLGYWAVGIPPSGPMDPLAHKLANRVVGNPDVSATLELTLAGPKLEFGGDAVIALAGARMPATLDGEPVAAYRPVRVRAGQTLALGPVEGPGCRAYLAVRGGFDVPPYLGSKTTFTLGGFGGHGGRALRAGDVLHVGSDAPVAAPAPLPAELVPLYDHRWQLGVLYGPHGAPDFFTERDIATLFATEWEVHFNSNRTGVRLIGPKPEWARPDGGEAGLHPSNIHDVAYAVGTIDFTGDMPILLGPDGPSLGGFVCPGTVVDAELWKLGQLRPGDRVRFVPITPETARRLETAQIRGVRDLVADPPVPLVPVAAEGAIVGQATAGSEALAVVYRRAGDKYLLIEYGPLVLDLRLRFRVHALMTWLQNARLPGILDLTPGIRSLQVHYDNAVLPPERLLEVLATAERELPEVEETVVPTRVVHLPLSWDDPATRLAIAKYAQSVRADAPWCPSNIEFIRRINGLTSIQDVHDVVFNASYLVLGLGDVYLGAPVATPLDPRQRLVTTKYNPARTWTPENAVGIGGAYLCIYGMEGPGGYQFVGRTLQVYNRFRTTSYFEPGSPWLLRFFDQIRFYPVTAEELLDMREAFPYGKVPLRVEEAEFRLAEYESFLAQNRESIATFKAKQQAAFDAERQRWIDSGQLSRPERKSGPFTTARSGTAVARTEAT